MKKILFSLFCVFCLFALVGCGDNKPNPNPNPNPEPPVDTLNYEKVLKEYLDEYIPTDVDKNIDLPEVYTFDDDVEAYLEWESANGRTVSSSGRYKQNLFDEEIALTAKVFYSNDNPESTYTKIIKTKGKEDLLAYKKIIESYLPDYVFKDFEVVTRDQTYKKLNLFGDISYEFADENSFKMEEVEEIVNNKKVTKTYARYINTDKEDKDVLINYTVKLNGMVIKGSKTIKIEGRNDEKFINAAKDFLDNYYKTDLIYDKIELPETDELGRVTITWKSSNNTIISDDGKLYLLKPNKTCSMVASINYNGNIQTWEKEFHTFRDNELVDFVMHRIHEDVIQQYVMHVYAYNKDNFGYLPFYYQDIDMKDIVTDTTAGNKEIHYVPTSTKNKNVDKLVVQTGLVPWENMGRPQRMKKGTYIITVHDTGEANQNAEWWNKLETTNDNRETSWNFTVGDKKIYQHIPINEVAWHAGDGRTEFSLRDTGVKFNGYDPEIRLGERFLIIDGKESKISIPYYGNKKANAISGSGLYTCLGDNGNYWIGDVYASAYSHAAEKYYVCTKGGNSTGIGIETDIYKGTDYNQVMRNCSNLVANLLCYFGLNYDRVLQHRHFSGKLCPQVMIQNDLWDYFLSMVQTEFLIKKYLPELKVTYQTSDTTLIDNTGKVLKKVDKDTKVTYTATATFNGETKTYNFETVIKPIPPKEK